VLPIAASERSARFTLADAQGQQQALAVDALGGDRYGLSLGNWTRRGVYRVTAARINDTSVATADETKLWEIPLAVNGPADESELDMHSGAGARSETGPNGRQSFVDATANAYSAAPVEVEAAGLWKWLMGGVLALLLGELLLAARFVPRAEAAR
jgi:hypothetical protein